MALGRGKIDGEIASYLGKGTEIAGDISFSSGMQVDGVIKGSVKSDASLVIGPSGTINAEVNVRKVTIKGEVRGVIRAAERVEIHKEGRVFGDIYSPCLIIEAGATFEGSCNMGDSEKKEAGQTISIGGVNSDFQETP